MRICWCGNSIRRHGLYIYHIALQRASHLSSMYQHLCSLVNGVYFLEWSVDAKSIAYCSPSAIFLCTLFPAWSNKSVWTDGKKYSANRLLCTNLKELNSLSHFILVQSQTTWEPAISLTTEKARAFLIWGVIAAWQNSHPLFDSSAEMAFGVDPLVSGPVP